MQKIYFLQNTEKELSNQKKAKEVLKELKNKTIYSLAPICWITFADISVPFSKLSFKDKLFM